MAALSLFQRSRRFNGLSLITIVLVGQSSMVVRVPSSRFKDNQNFPFRCVARQNEKNSFPAFYIMQYFNVYAPIEKRISSTSALN